MRPPLTAARSLPPPRTAAHELSDRLTCGLTACSTTPRSGKALVQQLARSHPDPHAHLYEEAKLALTRDDVALARVMLRQCPTEYRNVARYLAQCDAYDALLREGLVHRRETRELRRWLASVFGEHSAEGPRVCRHAEAIHTAGYTAVLLKTMTPRPGDAVLPLLDGDPGARSALARHFEGNNPPWLRAMSHLDRAVGRCGGWQRLLVKCLPGDAAPASTP